MDENPQNPPLDCHFSSEIVFFSSEILSKNREKRKNKGWIQVAGFRITNSQAEVTKCENAHFAYYICNQYCHFFCSKWKRICYENQCKLIKMTGIPQFLLDKLFLLKNFVVIYKPLFRDE